MAILACCCGGVPAQTAGTVRIEFASYTPKTMYDLVYKPRAAWPKQTVWGDLRLPAQAKGRVPVVILMHGSGGVEPAIAQWEVAFNEIGIATFVVYSYAPRGVRSTVADQTALPYAANVADALQAFKMLSRHRRIDRTRIGIMGFSRGGSVALQVALDPFRRAVLSTRRQFAFHIAAFAGCNQFYWSPRVSRAPILNLVGAADDYTTAASCVDLAARYREAGAQIRTVSYPGASHAWDSLLPVRWLPDASSGVACGVVRWDIETWKIYAERTGAFLAPTELAAFFAGCATRGAHVGRNEDVYRQSRAEVQAFAATVFFKTQGPASP